ncbi:MAG: RNA-binding S4 domain-containing protein [Gammaproteobacteria bacterium]|nr:RNA-binding S4 domain-containing protein [Gammaproteobacteria bacterium]NNC97061.1 RNA-binding S4 domain-containing protein [Gammaproteobacteria bacterium]NNM14343.1 RNA-binding S4 domain-containing protein [Gammaproteobacteria bacterium]
MHIIQIDREPVELFKILKFEALVSSGGEAKRVIANGLVTLDGVIETRKRKKIISGDVIGYAGQEYVIELLE